MRTFNPNQLQPQERHHLLSGAIGPRPIALVSTIGPDNIPNLAPFSFFNVFSSTPPVMIFSPSSRVQTSAIKDTLRNIHEQSEVVINVVNSDIVYQMAICGVDYAPEVDEFKKSGLTPLASTKVKPFRVKESPAQIECRVRKVITLDENPGAANLVISDVLAMHFADGIFDERGYIDPAKLKPVGRLGRAFYNSVGADNIFRIPITPSDMAIGIDQLPAEIRNSHVLTGAQLARLASVTEIPVKSQEVLSGLTIDFIHNLKEGSKNDLQCINQIHQIAASLIDQGEIQKAWQVLLSKMED